MHRSQRFYDVLLVTYLVCFFLSVVTCITSVPLTSVNEVLSNTLFFAGVVGMVLAGPAIILHGIIVILLEESIRSLLRSSLTSQNEEMRKYRATGAREEVPDNIIWKLDWGERGER